MRKVNFMGCVLMSMVLLAPAVALAQEKAGPDFKVMADTLDSGFHRSDDFLRDHQHSILPVFQYIGWLFFSRLLKFQQEISKKNRLESKYSERYTHQLPNNFNKNPLSLGLYTIGIRIAVRW
jgi:hypothetical protein